MPNELVDFYRQQFPDQAGLGDDEITMRYAASAEAYKQSGEDIFAKYPRFAADVQRLRRQTAEQNTGVWDYAKQAGGKLLGGAIETIGSIPEGLAIVANKITDGDVNLAPSIRSGIDAVKGAVTPEVADPEKKKLLDESFLASTVPEGLGSAAGFMATGGVTGLAGKAVGLTATAARTAGIALAGAAASGVEQYNDAKRRGADPDKAFEAFLLGAGVGLSEVIPLSKMLDRIDGMVPGVGKKAFVDMLVNAGKETVEESLQEAFQSGAGDVIAKEIVKYDPDRQMFESMKEDAAAGGVTGLLFSLLTQSVGRIRGASNQDSPTTDEQPAEPKNESTPPEPLVKPPDPINPEDVDRVVYEVNVKGAVDLAIRSLNGEDVDVEVMNLNPDEARIFRAAFLEESKKKSEQKTETPKGGEVANEDQKGKQEGQVLTGGSGNEAGSGNKPGPAQPDPELLALADSLEKRVKAGEFANEPPPQPAATTVAAPEAPSSTVKAAPAPAAQAEQPAAGKKSVASAVENLADKQKVDFVTRVNQSVESFAKDWDPARNKEYLQGDVDRVSATERELHTELEKLNKAAEEISRKAPKDAAEKSAMDKALVIISRRHEIITDQIASISGIKSDLQEKLNAFSEKGATSDLALSADAVDFEFGSLSAEIADEQAASVDQGKSSQDVDKAYQEEGAAALIEARDSGDSTDDSEESDSIGDAEPTKKSKKSKFLPGYFQANEESGAGEALGEAVASFEIAGSDSAKLSAIDEIGKILTANWSSRVSKKDSGASSARTRRVTAWMAKDGSVLLTTSYRRGGPKASFNKKYVFSVSPKADGSVGNNVGIADMLDAGYRPYASMLLRSPRHQLARRIQTVAAYDAEFGGLAADRDHAYGRYQSSVTLMPSGDAVDASVKTPGESLDSAGEEHIDIAAKWGSSNVGLVIEMAKWVDANAEALPDDVSKQFSEKINASIDKLGSLSQSEKVAIIKTVEGVITMLYSGKNRRMILGSGTSGRNQEAQGKEGSTGGSESGSGDQGGGSGIGNREGSAKDAESPSSSASSSETRGGEAEAPGANVADLSRAERAVREVDEMLAAGIISANDANGAKYDLAHAADDAEIADILSDLQSLAVIDRHRRSDSFGPDQVHDLESGRTSIPELIPDSPENARLNIERLRPPAQPPQAKGLLSITSVEELRSEYQTLKDALLKVSDETPGEGVSADHAGMIALRAKLAKALANSSTLSGITFQVEPQVTDVKGVPVLGVYSGANANISVSASGHAGVSDFHATILEEALHAHIGRLRLQADIAAGTVDSEVARAIFEIESVMARAKAEGLSWQDSNHASAVVQFDEFIASALGLHGAESSVLREGLAKVEVSDLQTRTPKIKTLWDRIRDAVSRIILRLFGAGADISKPSEVTALDAINNLVTFLVDNYSVSTSSAAEFASQVGPDKIDRNRKVTGLLGSSADISVDTSKFAADAKGVAMRMMATVNEVERTMSQMLNTWQSAGGNRSTNTGARLFAFDEFVKAMVNGVFNSKTMPVPDEVRTAINDALVKQGATPISTTVSIQDLEQRSEAPKAARDALLMLQRLSDKMAEHAKHIEDEFGKRKLMQRISETNTDLMDVVKRYADITVISREFTKELRRGIDESEDRGAKGIAKALGVKNITASVNAAVATARADTAAFTDSLQALAELGFDFSQLKKGTLTVTDVLNGVVASTEPALARFQSDRAQLALALQFAKRRPLVMDMLSVRAFKDGTERSALNSVVEIAMSNRSDAFDIARSELTKLKHLGAVGQRVVTQLGELKTRNRILMDMAERYARWEDFYQYARPVVDDEIRRMERRLAAEYGGVDDRQWEAVDRAVYFVPSGPQQPIESVFDSSQNSPTRRELRFGEEFSAPAVKEDIKKLIGWMDQNKNLAGSAKYRTLERMKDRLLQAQADNAVRQIQRGPGGWVVRMMGDISTQMEHLGLQASREAARQVKRFQSLFESHLHTKDQVVFYEFDRLFNEAMRATGIGHSEDFKRRFYNRALGYLESRQDVLATSPDPENAAIREVKAFLSDDPIIKKNAGAWPAIERLLRQSARCTEAIQEVRRSMGLKVRDTVYDGRVIFRESIGSPLFTMSRTVDPELGGYVSTAMATDSAWNSKFITVSGNTVSSLSPDIVSDLYQVNRVELVKALAARFTPKTLSIFVRPMVYKTGTTLFDGPTDTSGVSDLADRKNVIEAFEQSRGDMIRFAEILHDIEGGSPATLPGFVGKTMATFQSFYSQLQKIESSQRGSPLEGNDLARAFLDARQGENFPVEWLNYRTYGHVDQVRYVRILAQQAAYGDYSKDIWTNLNAAEDEMKKLADEYEKAMDPAVLPADRDRMLNDRGLKAARVNARKNLGTLAKIKLDLTTLNAALRGTPMEYYAFNEFVGLMAGATVQGVTTAATDTISMIESPFRKFGFSKEALGFVFGSWMNYGAEALGTLAQAIGVQWSWNAQHSRDTIYLNKMGLADVDAQSRRRGIKSLADRFAAEIGDAETLGSLWHRSLTPSDRIAAVAKYAGTRVSKAMRVALSSGIGKAKDPDKAYATLKLIAPFTQNNLWMHRAVARQWLVTARGAVSNVAAYLRAHPGDFKDLNFQADAKHAAFARKSLVGVHIDDRSWSYLRETLNRAGINIEESARRQVRGQDPFTHDQVQSILSLAQSEILLNSGVTTRPAWSMNNPMGRFFMPLVGWSISKTADLVKTTRDPKGVANARAFASAMTAMALAVVPASLAYALLRDEYEEEVLGKKQNVLPITWDPAATPMENTQRVTMALLDNMSRLGVFGIAGDAANSVFNVATTREFSIDSRVFFVSSMLNMGKIVGTLYQQDLTATFPTVWRPMLQSLGGSGYLQNFDAINNLFGMDNAERRVVRRINVGNQLRAVGREMGLEVRTGRGLVTTTNPVKPWISQMLLAAYANDPEGFQDSYQRALDAAVKEGETDPYAAVAESYGRMNPLRTVFGKTPTTDEYQRILSALGDDAAEVAEAIRNFNVYASQVPTGYGKSGIKPFYGVDRRESAPTDYRKVAAGFRGDFGKFDYRSVAAGL